MDKHTTTQGTPWAKTWDAEWAKRVEAAEIAEERRICGARTLAADPCTLQSHHPTGRCRYHGGTDAIGAPAGNQNARTHGLYARRLQRCGTHCPIWDHCPFAGEDVLTLEPKQRPVCAYEAQEYEQILEELAEPSSTVAKHEFLLDNDLSTQSTTSTPSTKSTTPNTNIHNQALLQVMLSRAAAALSITALTETVKSESENYRLHTTKQHPALQAFLRIARELRATQTHHASNPEQKSKTEDQRHPSLAELAAPMLERAEGVLEEAVEAERQREEYTRRLEWIALEHLGTNWREHQPIRQFALPRAKLDVGEPIHKPGFQTEHPPPNERPKFTPHPQPEELNQPP